MRPLTIKALLSTAALLSLVSCAPSTPSAADRAADEAALRAGSAVWSESYSPGGDVEKIVALFAEDAIVMPPNVPALKGRAAIRAFLLADVADSRAAGLKLTLAENRLSLSGDMGWRDGTDASVNAAGVAVRTGKWLEVWQKTDGKWLVVRDIWNDDAPPAATSAAAASAPSASAASSASPASSAAASAPGS